MVRLERPQNQMYMCVHIYPFWGLFGNRNGGIHGKSIALPGK